MSVVTLPSPPKPAPPAPSPPSSSEPVGAVVADEPELADSRPAAHDDLAVRLDRDAVRAVVGAEQVGLELAVDVEAERTRAVATVVERAVGAVVARDVKSVPLAVISSHDDLAVGGLDRHRGSALGSAKVRRQPAVAIEAVVEHAVRVQAGDREVSARFSDGDDLVVALHGDPAERRVCPTPPTPIEGRVSIAGHAPAGGAARPVPAIIENTVGRIARNEDRRQAVVPAADDQLAVALLGDAHRETLPGRFVTVLPSPPKAQSGCRASPCRRPRVRGHGARRARRSCRRRSACCRAA